jgi:hypothetical protein
MTRPISGQEDGVIRFLPQRSFAVQIAKQEILDVLDSLGRQDAVEQARQELPDQVDTEEHAGLLDQYGLDAQHLADKAAGQGIHGQQGGLLAGEGV